MAKNVKVLLGVCGGIAAYKAAELLRELQRQGAEVRVVMTRAAKEFVQPLTFESLSGYRVFADLWVAGEAADRSSEIEHIAQGQWADVLVIAPATAHTMAKLVHGMADDFLSATYLACTKPVVIAPSMNVNMWEHVATRANVLALKERGHVVVEPESGYLACGMTGGGRFAEIETIVRAVMGRVDQREDLVGETVLITAGGTREPIDPVRFLGNRSSGKMGFALAAAARRRGARVVVIAAATTAAEPVDCEIVRVETAAQMQTAVLSRLEDATVVIKTAAVADFRVRDVATEKMQRSGAVTLELEATEDIVRSVVEHRRAGTLVIAFAAEMGNHVARAREKLQRKGADAIVLNDISRAGIGFDADRNAVVFLTSEGLVEIGEAAKGDVAERILDEVFGLRMRGVLGMSGLVQS